MEKYRKILAEDGKTIILVDREDYLLLRQLKWWITPSGYAFTSILNKGNNFRTMHSLLVERREGFVVDHINRNKLDNRKVNLRVVSNMCNVLNRGRQKNNTTGVVGVYFEKESGRWRAMIGFNGRICPLGSFKKKSEAIEARRKAEKTYHHPFLLEGV